MIVTDSVVASVTSVEADRSATVLWTVGPTRVQGNLLWGIDDYYLGVWVKFMFSKKATKIDEIFTINVTLTT